MTTILVTGAGGPAAFNFIDSLKLKPRRYRTIGVDINPYHLALSNADVKFLIPPFSQPIAYFKAIDKLCRRYAVDLIHPQPDPEVAFLSQHPTKLSARTFLPQPATVKLCQNKAATQNRLAAHHIPVPQAFLIKTSHDLTTAFAALPGSTHWLRATQGAGSKAALPISTPAEARAWIRYWHDHKGIGYGQFMLSEFLPGKEYAFQSLWHKGRLIVSQARERLEYVFGNLTVSGQSSSPSVAKTVHNRHVNRIATAAVRTLDPKATGIFCLDLKTNQAGTPCVIEVNAGRFFTTSNFFSRAGCNMPDYYVRLALGRRLPTLPRYNPLPANLYWLRFIDMGTRLLKGPLHLNRLHPA